MNNMIDNINRSNISKKKKEEFLKSFHFLSKNKLPFFFDKKHVLGTLNIENSDSIATFIISETLVHQIEKRSGGSREICSPSLKLKVANKWILDNILDKIPVSKQAHGFVKNRSIVTNATMHIHTTESWLLRIDIDNFFFNISLNSIIKIFQNIGYVNEVANVLASICSYEGHLPQGFPTSPYLANLFLKEFDHQVFKFCEKLDSEVIYTRYADDLIISGLKKNGYTLAIKKVKKYIKDQLVSLNLTINSNKTKIQKKEIKHITGLNISQRGVSISNNYIKNIEQTIYYCKRFGIVGHLKYNNLENVSNFKGYLYGTAYFIKMIDPAKGKKILRELDDLSWS